MTYTGKKVHLNLEQKVNDNFPSTVTANLIQLPIYESLAFYGEHLQFLTKQRLRPYDWFTGHTSDFFGPAAVTSVYAIMFGKECKIPHLIAALLFTAGEFGQKNFYVQDVILYWLGAYTAVYTANKLKPKCKNLANKLTNYFLRCIK